MYNPTNPSDSRLFSDYSKSTFGQGYYLDHFGKLAQNDIDFDITLEDLFPELRYESIRARAEILAYENSGKSNSRRKKNRTIKI